MSLGQPRLTSHPSLVLGLFAMLSSAVLTGCSASSPGTQAAVPTPTGSAAGAADSAAKDTTAMTPTRITVGYPSTTLTMTGFYIAIQEGYAREDGVDPEMVLMNGTVSAQSMTAGETDFGMSAGALLAAYVRGAPVRNVFVQIDKPLYRLFAHPEVASMRDLDGKSVGIDALGASTHIAASSAIRAGGQDPARVTFVPKTNGPEAIPAIDSGVVAAAVMNPPFDAVAYRMGLRDLGFVGNYIDALTAGLATQERLIRDQPELVQRVVRANLKGHRFMQQNRIGTVEHMMRFQEVSKEDAELAYDTYIQYLTRDGTSTPETLERVLQDQRRELALQGADPGEVSVDEAFRLEFARRANAELDQAGWRPRP
jgi:NitT/TauT family transport system substrate-binding protein